MTLTHKGWGAALCALVLLTACGERAERDQAAKATAGGVAMDAAAPAAPPPVPQREGLAAQRAIAESAPDALQRRLLAVRHDLQLVTDPDAVESAWRQANEACAAAGCELLSSQLVRDDQRQPAQAALEARVPPGQLDAFLARVTALGQIGRHTRGAEDKTDEVIDTDARLKNMTEFRDHLRRLMATPGARLKDLIEVERELVRVQTEIDSLASRQKALAALTGKVHVHLTITPRPSVLEQGMWSPVRHAMVGAGHLFARSVATIIEFAVAGLPWLLVLVAAGLVLRGWRQRRMRTAPT
jgi:hypothetical protein